MRNFHAKNVSQKTQIRGHLQQPTELLGIWDSNGR